MATQTPDKRMGRFSAPPPNVMAEADFSSYEKERLQQVAEDPNAFNLEISRQQVPHPDVNPNAFDGPPQERSPEAATPETNAAPSNAENKQEGKQNTADEASGSGGKGDTAEAKDGGNAGKEKSELPGWVKARLSREKRKHKDAQERIEELEAKLAEKEGTAESKAPSQTLEAPERSDYNSVDEFFDDLDAWTAHEPLPHDPTGKYAKAAKSEADTAKPATAKAEKAKQTREEKLHGIIQETVDTDKSIEDENLHDKFMDLIDSGKIELTEDMLTFLAHEDNAAKLVQKFVESPVKSRRIAMLPGLEERVLEMDSLLKAVLNPAKDSTPPNPEETRAGFDSRPPPGGNPTQVDEDNESFPDYERRRKKEVEDTPWSFQ